MDEFFAREKGSPNANTCNLAIICWLITLWSAAFVAWIIYSASTHADFRSSMLYFRQTICSYNLFFLSSSYFKRTLVSFQTSCLSSKTFSILEKKSSNIGFLKRILLASFSTFKPSSSVLDPSWDRQDTSLAFDHSTLGFIVSKCLTFPFAVAIVATTQLMGCLFYFIIHPLKPCHQLIVGNMASAIDLLG